MRKIELNKNKTASAPQSRGDKAKHNRARSKGNTTGIGYLNFSIGFK